MSRIFKFHINYFLKYLTNLRYYRTLHHYIIKNNNLNILENSSNYRGYFEDFINICVYILLIDLFDYIATKQWIEKCIVIRT